jgi:hypothetical protein
VVKRKYLIVISLAIAVTLIGSVLYSLYLKPQEKNGEGIASIISVAHEPENPLLGEKSQ